MPNRSESQKDSSFNTGGNRSKNKKKVEVGLRVKSEN
jgi:hypothetical protein